MRSGEANDDPPNFITIFFTPAGAGRTTISSPTSSKPVASNCNRVASSLRTLCTGPTPILEDAHELRFTIPTKGGIGILRATATQSSNSTWTNRASIAKMCAMTESRGMSGSNRAVANAFARDLTAVVSKPAPTGLEEKRDRFEFGLYAMPIDSSGISKIVNPPFFPHIVRYRTKLVLCFKNVV